MPFQPMTSPSVFYGPLTQDQKETVLKNVKFEGARRFQKYREVLKNSLGLRDLKGTELMNAYRARTPDVWANLHQFFPDEYGRQMGEWGKLEHSAATKQVQIPPLNPALTSPDAKTMATNIIPRESA